MLAEHKQKVIYSNPRGTLWANDKEKFGQKMLESMGWREGQGLGKEQNGIKESIKPSYKFDSKGLGYDSSKSSNVWIEDNNVYEQILSDLSKHYQQNNLNDVKNEVIDDNEPIDSEEQTQKPKKDRFRYRKFLQAKNLSIKSKEELHCIFPTMKNGESTEDQQQQQATKEQHHHTSTNHDHQDETYESYRKSAKRKRSKNIDS